MRILLCGANGKMGKVVYECASAFENTDVVAGVDPYGENSNFPLYRSFDEVNTKADVIIDFSHPALLSSMLKYATENKIPAVVATTGLDENGLNLIKEASKEIPVFFTANMSLGVNLISELAKKAAAVLSPDFDIEIVEMHHNQKIDAPSGTALLLADEISSALENEPVYEFDRHSKRMKRSKNEIGISSVRGGTIVGEHEIIFAGTDEVIKISHSAYSKKLFANGAINAAKFIVNAKSGLYSMKDVLEEE